MNEHQLQQKTWTLKDLFISLGEHRLRAGWRLLLQGTLHLTIVGCLGILLIAILVMCEPWLSYSMILMRPEYGVLFTFIEALAVTISVFLARRFFDKQSIESLGLRLDSWAVLDIFVGIGITLLQMGLIFAIMSWLGWITFQGFAWDVDTAGTVIRNVLLYLTIFMLVAWNEELLSRGYHLQTIASGLNMFWGVLISSAVFGILHLANPGANWISSLGIFLAGLFFAYAYLRTKQLWLPMGMHLGWNFFEGVIFGFPVSGLDVYPLTILEIHGPELWTGGAFGPEAGLVLLPALMLGAALIYFYTAYRRR